MTPDATLNPLPPGALPAGCERRDPGINTIGLNPVLMAFLTKLGLIHLHLFDEEVIITSGREGAHAPNSKHYKGDAIDLRILDKLPRSRPLFLLVLYELAQQFPVAVFDESNLKTGPHVHVEIAG